MADPAKLRKYLTYKELRDMPADMRRFCRQRIEARGP